MSFFSRKLFFCALTAALVTSLPSQAALQADDNNFCQKLTTILADAYNKFADARGEMLSGHQLPHRWAAKTQVGKDVITADAHSASYEAVLYSGKSIEQAIVVYGAFKQQLRDCLAGTAFHASAYGNSDPDLQACDLIIYEKSFEQEYSGSNALGYKANPYLSLLVKHDKTSGDYVVQLRVLAV